MRLKHEEVRRMRESSDNVSDEMMRMRLFVFHCCHYMACLVGWENVKELESLESLGFCVIYIYPGAHKFSLSISHFFWAPHTLFFIIT